MPSYKDMITIEEKASQLSELVKSLDKVGFTANFKVSKNMLVLVVNKKKSKTLNNYY